MIMLHVIHVHINVMCATKGGLGEEYFFWWNAVKLSSMFSFCISK